MMTTPLFVLENEMSDDSVLIGWIDSETLADRSGEAISLIARELEIVIFFEDSLISGKEFMRALRVIEDAWQLPINELWIEFNPDIEGKKPSKYLIYVSRKEDD